MECWGPWIWHTKCVLPDHQTSILFLLSLKRTPTPAWNCWTAFVHIHSSFALICCPHSILLIPHWSSLIVACCFQGKDQSTVLAHLRSPELAHHALATLDFLLFLICMELPFGHWTLTGAGTASLLVIVLSSWRLSLHINSPLPWLSKVMFPCLPSLSNSWRWSLNYLLVRWPVKCVSPLGDHLLNTKRAEILLTLFTDEFLRLSTEVGIEIEVDLRSLCGVNVYMKKWMESAKHNIPDMVSLLYMWVISTFWVLKGCVRLDIAALASQCKTVQSSCHYLYF